MIYDILLIKSMICPNCLNEIEQFEFQVPNQENSIKNIEFSCIKEPIEKLSGICPFCENIIFGKIIIKKNNPICYYWGSLNKKPQMLK